MQAANKKTIAVLVCLTLITLSSGCTNWKKKYQLLRVENENVKGLLARAESDKGQLAAQVSQGQQTMAELQKRIAEQNQTPGQASGFGDDYEVAFDTSKGTITVTLPNSILFAPGKAMLKKATSADLDHIYSILQDRYLGRQIDVVGHTDSDPIKRSKWKDNWELSAQRALTVVRYLAKQGIAEDEIREIGCGAARPVAPNTSSSSKAKNRRVEIVVHLK